MADEPVAALDSVTAKEFMDDFKRINKSILINIHHVDLALKYADRVVGIKVGEIIYDGPSTDVTPDVLKEIYGRDVTKDEMMSE